MEIRTRTNLGDFADIAAISSDDVWVVGDAGAYIGRRCWVLGTNGGMTDFL